MLIELVEYEGRSAKEELGVLQEKLLEVCVLISARLIVASSASQGSRSTVGDG